MNKKIIIIDKTTNIENYKKYIQYYNNNIELIQNERNELKNIYNETKETLNSLLQQDDNQIEELMKEVNAIYDKIRKIKELHQVKVIKDEIDILKEILINNNNNNSINQDLRSKLLYSFKTNNPFLCKYSFGNTENYYGVIVKQNEDIIYFNCIHKNCII